MHKQNANRYRLIPARAGKTGSLLLMTLNWTAHPRACGENFDSCCRCCFRCGSSPRVRGKPRRVPEAVARQRLIPARAGKTPTAISNRTGSAAHPRACGENYGHQVTPGYRGGSSPRVRGKRTQFLIKFFLLRLIPARAGKTESMGVSLDQFWGSSPRVRGKHFLTWAFTAQAGQILETLEPSAFSGSYSFPGARANGGQRRAHRRGLCTGPALGRLLGAS